MILLYKQMRKTTKKSKVIFGAFYLLFTKSYFFVSWHSAIILSSFPILFS